MVTRESIWEAEMARVCDAMVKGQRLLPKHLFSNSSRPRSL